LTKTNIKNCRKVKLQKHKKLFNLKLPLWHRALLPLPRTGYPPEQEQPLKTQLVKIKKLTLLVVLPVLESNPLASQSKRKKIVDPTGDLGNSTTTMMKINIIQSRLRLRTHQQWQVRLRSRQRHLNMLREEQKRRRPRHKSFVTLTHLLKISHDFSANHFV